MRVGIDPRSDGKVSGSAAAKTAHGQAAADRRPGARLLAAALLVALPALAAPHGAAQRRDGARGRDDARRLARAVVRVASGGDTIPVILTACGVTTMLSLPEEANEAVCGDLYDPETGTGAFVIQRSGRDLFLKPLRAGASNLFVKTERATYAFDLEVVAPSRAMRIVHVEAARPAAARPASARPASARPAAAPPASARPAPAAPAGRPPPPGSDAPARGAAGVPADGAPSDEPPAAGLVASFAAGLVAVGGNAYLRCRLENRGTAEVAVSEAEVRVAGASGTDHAADRAAARRVAVDAVLAPGATKVVLLRFDGRPDAAAEVLFLDPAGAELLHARPFAPTGESETGHSRERKSDE